MANDHLTIDEMKRMADEIGLSNLTDEHLEELLRATLAARARRTALHAASLIPADEPAHVFSLARGDER